MLPLVTPIRLRVLLALILLVVVLQGVAAVGDAPISLLGRVTTSGGPEVGVSVWLKAYRDNVEVAQSQVQYTNSNGLFFTIVTVPDGYDYDLQVTIETEDSSYVELLEAVRPWQRYELDLDLASQKQSIPYVVDSSSPSSYEFELDMRRIIGEGLSDDLIEKYDVNHVFVAQRAELERPGVFSASSSTARWLSFLVVVLVITALFVSRWLMKR